MRKNDTLLQVQFVVIMTDIFNCHKENEEIGLVLYFADEYRMCGIRFAASYSNAVPRKLNARITFIYG
jgi:hypothetical protein